MPSKPGIDGNLPICKLAKKTRNEWQAFKQKGKGEKEKMNELKNHGKKWLYWFALGVAIIVVYKALDNFTDIMEVVTTFFDIVTPFLVGII